MLNNRPKLTDELKRPASRRTLPVASMVLESLAEHMRRWPSDDPDGLIFQGARGGRVRRSDAAERFTEARRKAGVESRCTFHSLRHAYASYQIAEGVPLPTVAKLMGHETVDELIRTYAHAIPSQDVAAVRASDAVLGRTFCAPRVPLGVSG
jgi:integrase